MRNFVCGFIRSATIRISIAMTKQIIAYKNNFKCSSLMNEIDERNPFLTGIIWHKFE